MGKTLNFAKLRGETITFESIVEISQYRLHKIWDSHFSDKPFPNVRAFILEDNEFLRVDERLEAASSTILTDEKEYGHKVQREKDVGLVFPTFNIGIVILVREHSMRYTTEEVLEHELNHTYNGDAEMIRGKPK